MRITRDKDKQRILVEYNSMGEFFQESDKVRNTSCNSRTSMAEAINDGTEEDFDKNGMNGKLTSIDEGWWYNGTKQEYMKNRLHIGSDNIKILNSIKSKLRKDPDYNKLLRINKVNRISLKHKKFGSSLNVARVVQQDEYCFKNMHKPNKKRTLNIAINVTINCVVDSSQFRKFFIETIPHILKMDELGYSVSIDLVSIVKGCGINKDERNSITIIPVKKSHERFVLSRLAPIKEVGVFRHNGFASLCNTLEGEIQAGFGTAPTIQEMDQFLFDYEYDVILSIDSYQGLKKFVQQETNKIINELEKK